MKLLYISYWELNNPLTKATIFPSLEALQPYFSEKNLATIERTPFAIAEMPKAVVHKPYYVVKHLPKRIGKALDLALYSVRLLLLARRSKIDIVICRGSMAGFFGLVLRKILSIPFIVESFEPHADYMVEGNTWKKGGLEHQFQKWVEMQCIKYAKYLLPVSKNYAAYLDGIGVDSTRVLVMPCCVDLGKFQSCPIERQINRARLRVEENAIVGIYVGKFGDIYLDIEAFDLFRQAQIFFGSKFFLIILSPNPTNEIIASLTSVDFDLNRAHVDCVPHESVPGYLAAADFAFSLIRPSASRKYCSPVKNGEYWAAGLPIVLTKGVGDDENIIISSNTGIILDFNQAIEPQLMTLKDLLSQDRQVLAKRVVTLAREHRNIQIIVDGYEQIFRNGVTSIPKYSSIP